MSIADPMCKNSQLILNFWSSSKNTVKTKIKDFGNSMRANLVMRVGTREFSHSNEESLSLTQLKKSFKSSFCDRINYKSVLSVAENSSSPKTSVFSNFFTPFEGVTRNLILLIHEMKPAQTGLKPQIQFCLELLPPVTVLSTRFSSR